MAKTEKARLIQLIKIGQKQLNMDDDTYRLLLMRLTNKNSATKLTVVEMYKVLFELKQKGAKIPTFLRKRSTNYSPATGEVKVKSEISHKIRAVWIQMGKQGFLADGSERALNTYMRKVVCKKDRDIIPLNVGVLNGNDATHLLEILKQWHKRVMIKRLAETYGCLVSVDSSYDQVCLVFEGYMI